MNKSGGKDTNMNPQFLTAEELGIRLEIAGNLAIWEASPIYKHQKAVDRLRDSFKKAESDGNPCECLDVADVYVQPLRLNLNAVAVVRFEIVS